MEAFSAARAFRSSRHSGSYPPPSIAFPVEVLKHQPHKFLTREIVQEHWWLLSGIVPQPSRSRRCSCGCIICRKEKRVAGCATQAATNSDETLQAECGRFGL